MTYKFLLFDLDHTLLDFDLAEDVALSHLLKEEEVEDIQAYKDYYVPMNKTLWKDFELKKITKQELVNTRFAKLFAHFGIEKDGAYLAERYQFFLSKQGQIFPGVEDLLKKLIHQGFELYLCDKWNYLYSDRPFGTIWYCTIFQGNIYFRATPYPKTRCDIL